MTFTLDFADIIEKRAFSPKKSFIALLKRAFNESLSSLLPTIRVKGSSEYFINLSKKFFLCVFSVFSGCVKSNIKRARSTSVKNAGLMLGLMFLFPPTSQIFILKTTPVFSKE